MINIKKYDNKVKSIVRVDMSVLGNRETLNRSCLDKKTKGITTSDLWMIQQPKEGGLVDLAHGSCSHDSLCSTCNYVLDSCISHESHIKLAYPVFHILFYEFLIKIFNCVCTNCSTILLPSKDKENIIEYILNKEQSLRMNEIKKYRKGMTYCEKCNAPIAVIKPNIQKKKGLISITKEYTVSNVKEEKKKIVDEINSIESYNILRNISPNDSKLLGLTCTPSDLMLSVLPVPGVHMRPSIRGDFSTATANEDMLTLKLVEIYKANEKTIQNLENTNITDEIKQKYLKNSAEILQFNISTYQDNTSLDKAHTVVKSGQPTKSLVTALKGKEGRLRSNLMKKRVFHSSRTVITSDPTLSIDQVGIPVYVAKILTYPEMVTPNNIKDMIKLVQNGPYLYPGANFVLKVKKNKLYDLRKDKPELEFGDIVERHLQDDDKILFNRQPTLHKHGIMTHRAKIINNLNYNTFRLNPSVCTCYNADFDGDEMNAHTPQSILSDIELSLASVKNLIISPKNSAPIVKVVQDCLVGSYNMTKFNDIIKWEDAINIYASTNSNDFSYFKKNEPITGKQLFSSIIPKYINLTKKKDNNYIVNIKNSKIIDGFIGSDSVGSSKNNLTQQIWEEYNPDITKNFINNTNILAIYYNFYRGFTIGIGDYILNNELRQNIQLMIYAKKLEVLHELTEYENNPELLEQYLFEHSVKEKLTNVRGTIQNYVYKNLPDTNNAKIMIDCGSKGSALNLVQVAGCLAQQDYEGNRMPANYNNRASPYFPQFDDRPESRGFIDNSFITGLNLHEFFFHTTTAREGCIDTTVKTANTGYIQRKLVKATEDFMVKYDGTVRNSNDKIYQFIYGDAGYDASRQTEYKIEFLEMNNETIKNNFIIDNDKYANNDFYNEIINSRDFLRDTQLKAHPYSVVFISTFFVPVNLNRLINMTIDMQFDSKKTTTTKYIFDKINYILQNDVTLSFSMTNNEKNNKNGFKFNDDIMVKLVFKCCLYDSLNPKKLIQQYKFTDEHIDFLTNKIINDFNKSHIEYGEMCGTIASTSLGEPATQMTLNSFHSSGIGGKSAVNQGIPRLNEIISVSKNIKTPFTTIYLKDKTNEKIANNIASQIKFTTISDIKNNISIYYENKPHDKNSFMIIDNATNIFNPAKQSKTNVLNKIDGLNWLIRIEFNKEKMFLKQITLLDIKIKFALFWEKRFVEKNVKRDKKKLLTKIKQIAILSNSENNETPIIHIRCSTLGANKNDLIMFKEKFIDEFKIKGIEDITEIFEDKPVQQKHIYFDENGNKKDINEYVIRTKGINIEELRNIAGIDLNRTLINDITLTYKYFGLEATRNLIVDEIKQIYDEKGASVSIQHIEIFADCICSNASLTSLDRHGLNKLTENGVISRATFERPVVIIKNAAVFGTNDPLNSVSSRIALGLCIKSGTNSFDVTTDTKSILNSEYFDNNTNLYGKKYTEIDEQQKVDTIDNDIFVPDF